MAVPNINDIPQPSPDSNCPCLLSGISICYCDYWSSKFSFPDDITDTIPSSDFYLAPDPEPDPPPPLQLSLQVQVQVQQHQHNSQYNSQYSSSQNHQQHQQTLLGSYSASPLLNTPLLDFETSYNSSPALSAHSSPWIPISGMASPHGSAVSYSSFGSPAPDLSLAESPGNYAMSPAASTSFSWPNSGCGLGFTTTRPSNLIKSSSVGQDSGGSQCDVCSLSFPTRKELKRHQSVAHEKGLAFKCRVEGCIKARSGHVYNRRDNFVRHLKTAHVDAEDFDVEDMVKSCAFVRRTEGTKDVRRRK